MSNKKNRRKTSPHVDKNDYVDRGDTEILSSEKASDNVEAEDKTPTAAEDAFICEKTSKPEFADGDEESADFSQGLQKVDRQCKPGFASGLNAFAAQDDIAERRIPRKRGLLNLDGKGRFAELDFIRGVCVLLMIFDHFMMDLQMWFWGTGVAAMVGAYWVSAFRIFWHYVVVNLFLLLCGISCRLSRSNFKRGLVCFGAACFLTWGTYMLENTGFFDGQGIFIPFGVLHMLGLSMLTFAVLDKIAAFLEKKIGKHGRWARLLPAVVGVILGIIFFTCIFSYAEREIFYGKPYEGDFGYLAAIVGYEAKFAGEVFYSADFFPLFPYVSVVLIGSAVGEFVYRNRRRSLVPLFEKKGFAPINFVGRNALVVYVVHQIVLNIILALVSFAI